MRIVLYVLCLLLGAEKLAFAECQYQDSIAPLESPTAREAVLLLSGYGGNTTLYTRAAWALAQQGIASYRCSFASTATERNRSALEDLGVVIAAYDTLATRSGSTHISVMGTSLGALEAVLLTEHRPVKRLVLHAPAIYPEHSLTLPLSAMLDAGKATYQALHTWRETPLTCEVNTAILAMLRFNGEVLLIRSAKDESIPIQTVENYRRAAAHVREIILDGAGHADEKSTMFITLGAIWLG